MRLNLFNFTTFASVVDHDKQSVFVHHITFVSLNFHLVPNGSLTIAYNVSPVTATVPPSQLKKHFFPP